MYVFRHYHIAKEKQSVLCSNLIESVNQEPHNCGSREKLVATKA